MHSGSCTCQLCYGGKIISPTPSIPWLGSFGSSLTLPEPQPFLKVRKVENGYVVVVKDGKEFVITEPSQIIQFFDETK